MNTANVISIICAKLGVQAIQGSPLEIIDSSGSRAVGPFAEMVQDKYVSGAMKTFLVFKEAERQRASYRDTQWGHVGLTESEYQQWVSNPSTFRHPEILEAIAKEEDQHFWEMALLEVSSE